MTDPKENSSPKIRLNSNKAGEKLTILIVDQIRKLIDINNETKEKLHELEDKITSLNQELDKTRDQNKQYQEKIARIEDNMGKFIGLYEIITSQFNPFVHSSDNTQDMPDIHNSTVFKDIPLEDVQQSKEQVDSFHSGVRYIQSMGGTDPAIDPRLAKYIASQLKQGKSKSDIRERLSSVGWTLKTIDGALSKLD